MAIRFEITGDNSNVLHSFDGTSKGVKKMSNDVEKSGASIENMFNRIRNAAAMALAGLSGKELAQQIVNVRGEFQKLEISFKTMLGSADKANTLMNQLVTTAAVTPFDLKGIASGAKQLLAYGMEAEKVNDTIVRLGDIAAGLDQPLGDLIYLYGTTMAQGRMYTQDLNQFMGRGIPLLGELAKMFKVTETQVRGLVTEGKVGFTELEQVIKNLTNEGGRFGGLMKEQSASWPGKISNIGDALDNMFNEIGKDNESVVNGALDVVSSLVENYEQVGRVLMGLVTIYGTYKVAVMAVSAVQSINSMITKQAAVEKALAAAASITLGDAEAIAAAKTKIFTLAVNKAKLSVAALGKTMLANPYVLAATAVAGLVAVYMSLETEEEKLKHAEERYNKEKEKAIELDKKRKEQAEKSMQIAENEGNATDTRKEALRRLMAIYPEVFEKYDTEYERLKNIRDIKLEIAEIEEKKQKEAKRNELAKDKERFAELEKKKKELHEAMMAAAGYGPTNYNAFQLSSEEDAEYKLLKKKIAKDEQDINKEDDLSLFEKKFGTQSYKQRLKNGATKDSLISELDKHIKQYEDLISRMELNGSKVGYFKGSKTAYSIEELQAQMIQLKTTKNELNAPTHDTAGWIDVYRGKLKEAEKDLAEFKKNKDKMSEEDFQKGLKEKQGAVSLAKKSLQDLGVTLDTNKKVEDSENKILEAKQERNDELLRLERENQRAVADIMEEGREKRLAEIENEYNEREDAIREHIDKFIELNLKSGASGELTAEQFAIIEEMQKNSRKKREKDHADMLRQEEADMRSYLKTYGSLMQQKSAIAADYDEKIRLASSQGERNTFIRQKGEELQNADVNDLLKRVDWAMAFSDIGLSFENMLKPILGDLKAFVKTDAFRGQSASDQKAVIEAMENVRSIVGENGSWQELAVNLQDYQNTLKEYTDALTDERRIAELLKTAKADREIASESGNIASYEEADARVEAFSQQLSEAGTKVYELGNNVNASGSLVESSAYAAIQPISKITTFLNASGIPALGELFTAFDQLKGGINALKAIGNAGKDISDAGEDISKGAKEAAEKASELIPKEMSAQLSKAGAIAQIISAILTILDILKDGIGPIISGVISSVLNAISGLIENILSGKFIEQIVNSLWKGIGGIFKTLAEKLVNLFTLGSVDINWTGSNAKEVQETIDRLTDRNEKLQGSIEDLTEEMELGRGAKSVSAYKEARENQSEMNKNYLEIAKAQAGYHNHHHSWNHYWEGFSEEDMAWIRANVNADFNGDLFSLTPEEMKKLRANVEIWNKIQSTGKGGYGDRLTDTLDDYIDQAGKLEELTNRLYEGLTGITFENVYDNFIDMLMSLEDPTKEAAENLGEIFMKAMLSYKISAMFEEDLKKWWEAFGKAMESDGLDADEKELLLKQYLDMLAEAQGVRDEVAGILGYNIGGTTQQGSTKQGFATASQESIDVLSGRALSNQITLNSIDNNILAMFGKVTAMAEIITSNSIYLADIRTMMLSANSYLDDIAKYVKLVYVQFGSKLDMVVTNTKNI